MRLTTRRSDDADVIRARLRVLLQQDAQPPGWLPEDIGDGARPDAADEGTPGRERRRDAGEDDRAGLPAGIGRHRAPGTAVRIDPGRRGAWSLWLAGLLAALAVTAWTWLDRPQVEPVTGGTTAPTTVAADPPQEPAPATPAVGEVARTGSTVVVSVVGLVARPGLVTLPAGARVADAVAAAGGLLPEADPASVNLAAVVSDGQQVAVGVPGSAPGGGPGTAAGPGGAAPVDLNTATVADLDALPGIGPVLAERIVEHRSRQGRFTSVEQLDDVPGIGPTIYAELAPLVRV